MTSPTSIRRALSGRQPGGRDDTLLDGHHIRAIDLEDHDVRPSGKPKRPRVEPGTDDHDLPIAGSDGVEQQLVEEPGANSDPVTQAVADTRRLEAVSLAAPR